MRFRSFFDGYHASNKTKCGLHLTLVSRFFTHVGVQPYEDATAISTPVRWVICQDRLACWRTLPWTPLCTRLLEPWSCPSFTASLLHRHGKLLPPWPVAGPCHGPSYHHDLFVAHWGNGRQALFTLLCVS